MRSINFLIFIAAFLTVFEVTATRAFDLSGWVKNKRHEPQANVKIDLEGPRAYFTISDDQGRFKIREFEAGRYSVRAHRGRSSQTFFREIVENGRLELLVDW